MKEFLTVMLGAVFAGAMVFIFVYGTAIMLIDLFPNPAAKLSHKAQCHSDLNGVLEAIKNFAGEYPRNDAAFESFTKYSKHMKKEGRWICHTLGPVLIKGE